MSYLALQANGYSDTASDYTACNNREGVVAQLIDYGYLDNPAITVYKVPRGTLAADYAQILAESVDPYPDWVVSRGSRSGARWERA